MVTDGGVQAVTSGWWLDRGMMQSVLALSSCERARVAAAAWIAAFDAARASGAAEDEAEANAAEAWRSAYG
jgi:hypothetical protein